MTRELTAEIISVAIEVHRQLGPLAEPAVQTEPYKQY